jgi:hypothetical protein
MERVNGLAIRLAALGSYYVPTLAVQTFSLHQHIIEKKAIAIGPGVIREKQPFQLDLLITSFSRNGHGELGPFFSRAPEDLLTRVQ